MARRLGWRLAGAIGVAATMAAAPAAAKDFVYGSWVSPKHGVNVDGLEPFFAAVAKDTSGSVNWKLLAGGQVVSARSTLDNIRDRVIDAGLVIPVFTLKELKAGNTIFDMQVFGDDPVAVAGSATETLMLRCPECLDEYRRHKAVYLGGYGTTDFKLICDGTVASLADVANKKVRAVGAAVRWAKAMNAIPVSLPPTDALPAMQRGALSCVIGPYAWLKSYGYMDVAKAVLDNNMSFPRGLGMFVMNRESWDSLSLGEKRTMLKHMPAATARATLIGYVAEDAELRKEALAKGIKIVKLGREYDELMAKHKESERKAIADAMRQNGVKEPERIIAAALDSLAKWEKLAREINGDVDRFAKALNDHIYAKIDPAKW
jgi:TRAP-type C4-dicarboxylate transport system substrate-binding protein